jgi:hypothetical protein
MEVSARSLTARQIMYRSVSTMDERIIKGSTYVHKGNLRREAKALDLTCLSGGDCNEINLNGPPYCGGANPHQFYRGGASPLLAAHGRHGHMASQRHGSTGGSGLPASRLGGGKKGRLGKIFWERAGGGARVHMGSVGGYESIAIQE